MVRITAVLAAMLSSISVGLSQVYQHVFNCTTSVQELTIPHGVTHIDVKLVGGGGGADSGNNGNGFTNGGPAGVEEVLGRRAATVGLCTVTVQPAEPLASVAMLDRLEVAAVVGIMVVALAVEVLVVAGRAFATRPSVHQSVTMFTQLQATVSRSSHTRSLPRQRLQPHQPRQRLQPHQRSQPNPRHSRQRSRNDPPRPRPQHRRPTTVPNNLTHVICARTPHRHLVRIGPPNMAVLTVV